MKTDIPTDSEQRWEWIKFQLRMRSSSLAQIARELGVNRSAVINAKALAYPRVERAIARQLKLDPIQIWPERWSSNGIPNRQRPARRESLSHDSDSRVITHCQSVVEA